MLITIHNLKNKPRYVWEIRDTFDLHERCMDPGDVDDENEFYYMVNLENASINTIGDRIVVITSLTHPGRAGVFISAADFSTIEIC